VGRVAAAALAALALAVLSGCASAPREAPRETYMVMPEADGKAGTIVVTLKDGREEVLHGAYQAMTLSGEKSETFVGNQEQLERTFGPAVAALPKPPMTATLFFLSGRDELTAESRVAAEAVYRDFLDRKAPEVWIIGHTDTVGSSAYNEALSVRRADRVRQALLRLGVPAGSIEIKGMGKRDPLVRTPDGTDEPRNRRVEISVR
jgi:outer membrane protein OmpA-like peptidoglycan-associated protein